MEKPKLIRITTIPLSLEKLLEGQLAFMKDYFEVTAISSEKERLVAYTKKEGVSYYFVNLTRKITPFKDIAAVYKLYRYFSKVKPAIVHTHTPKAGIVGMMAAYFARVPNRLHTVAGLPLMESTGFKRSLLGFIEKLTYRFATKVYPNSQGLQDFILKEKFTQKRKLNIIGNGSSNGIDTRYFSKEKYDKEFQKSFRKELSIPEEDFVFVFVGRIVKDKGIVELVNAFSMLQNKKSTLLLVGPFEQDLDPLPVDTLQLIRDNAKIVSVGYQQDVRPYFAISNVLVFPSYREGFPNVVLQALSMELPAIVSDINGCNEIVTHGFNGLIIPKKSEKELQGAMFEMMNDKGQYQSLKQNTRTSITKNYERLEIWNALLKEYQSFLDQKV